MCRGPADECVVHSSAGKELLAVRDRCGTPVLAMLALQEDDVVTETEPELGLALTGGVGLEIAVKELELHEAAVENLVHMIVDNLETEERPSRSCIAELYVTDFDGFPADGETVGRSNRNLHVRNHVLILQCSTAAGAILRERESLLSICLDLL